MQIHKKLKLVFVSSCVAVSSVLLASCNGGSTAQVSLGQANNGDTALAKGLTTDLEWAELAQQREAITLPLQQDHPAEQNKELGRWGVPIDWPHIAAGAASLPSGRIASWASSATDDFRNGSDYTHAAIYDPVTKSFTDTPNEGHDLFGVSVTKTSDGRTMAIGGSHGVTTTSVLDGNGWSVADALPQPRAFGQATALADGSMMALDGATATAVQWRTHSGWSEVAGAMAADLAALPQASLEQIEGATAMVVAPDGRLFTAGSGEESFSLDLQGGYQPHGAQSADSANRLYGTTVMYDVGKLLVAGGGRPSLSSAVTIDINGAAPVVTTTDSLHSPRSMHNSVLLPDGQVMVLGGTEAGIPFSDESSVFEPELWNPVSEQWQKLAPHRFPRNYQSTALLMKDARVAAMGGGLCGDCASNYDNAEIFEPPYLFNADGSAAVRPDIVSAPSQASVGETITVTATVTTGAAIERYNLVRISAVTRHHNGDQRLVPVSISSGATNEYELYLSQNANVLLPGAYWLYAIDSLGVPSIGHTIQILSATETEQGTAPETPNQEQEQEQAEQEQESEPQQPVITPAADAQSCATQGELCVLPIKAIATVWYGNNGNWAVVTDVTDAILCEAETFATDASATDNICTFLVTGELPDATLGGTDTNTDETDNAGTGDAVSDNDGDGADSDTEDNNEDNTQDNTNDSGDNSQARALPDGSLFQRGDVLALHYDVAADIDDIHAIASGKTIVEFYDITPAVVVGTYGFDNNRRETYHVKFKDLTRKEAANHVATLAYGSDGYLDTKGYQADLEIAAGVQAAIWKQALDAGNDIWVAEGGPSDFTEEVMQQLLQQGVTLATLQTKVHVVQHSIAANEGNTADASLVFVKANTDYITLQNGNQRNATADLNTGVAVDDYFRNWASNSAHPAPWEFSMVYFEEKLDFSDTVEILHILNIGTDMIADTNDFADFFD